jgi:hypothetical protein
MNKKYLTYTLLVLFSGAAFGGGNGANAGSGGSGGGSGGQNAGQLDEHDQKALKETQELLTDKANRQESLKNNAKGTDADAGVRSLLGGDAAMTEEVYALAADVFANVVKDAGGDVTKMQEMMAKFHRNPAAFADSWTPEQKAKLRKLAEKLGKPEMAPKK